MVGILITAIDYFVNFLFIVIFIRVFISWLPIGRDNNLVKILYMLTEPILGPIRTALRKSPIGGPGMMLDFSPVIAFLIIHFVRYMLLTLIVQVALK